jgi:hypothetical protein
MKKYLISLVAIWAFVPFFAKAEAQLFWFMDNKGYDLSGQVQAFKLMDGNCYDVAGLNVTCPGETPNTAPTPLVNQVANLPAQNISVSPVSPSPAPLPTATLPDTPTLVTGDECIKYGYLAGCEFTVSKPVATAPKSVIPNDTTAPQLVGLSYIDSLSNHNDFHRTTEEGTFYQTPEPYESPQGRCLQNGFDLIASFNEPVRLKIDFLKADSRYSPYELRYQQITDAAKTEPLITVNIDTFSKTHGICVSDYGLEEATNYYFHLEAFDKADNKFTLTTEALGKTWEWNDRAIFFYTRATWNEMTKDWPYR